MQRGLLVLVTVGLMALLAHSGSVTHAQYYPSPSSGPSAVVESGAGADAAAISATVDAFRADLGGDNNAANPPAQSGRREINWDGVPANVEAPNPLPADFFNKNSARGVVFSTPGSGFEVSADDGVAPVRFGDINPSYSATFSVFSPQRLFTPLGSNVMDVNFFVPGTSTPATVSGFGAVFTNVQLANTTAMQFWDAGGNSLGVWYAAVSPPAGLSFLGVSYPGSSPVARARITTGNAALGPSTNDGYGTNVVAMDDFIYGEPVASGS